jgi:hypothetical protein
VAEHTSSPDLVDLSEPDDFAAEHHFAEAENPRARASRRKRKTWRKPHSARMRNRLSSRWTSSMTSSPSSRRPRRHLSASPLPILASRRCPS